MTKEISLKEYLNFTQKFKESPEKSIKVKRKLNTPTSTKSIHEHIGKSNKKKDQRNDKLNHYEKVELIARRIQGDIYSTKIKTQKDSKLLVWKEQNKEDLEQLSAAFLEISYNLLLDFKNEDIHLIKVVDVFIGVSNDKQHPYKINIITEKADQELKDMMMNDKRMDFFTLLQLFKDTLAGLTLMNISYLTHRDLKPSNILLKDNKYLLADYGEGLNLFFDSKKCYKLFYQVGKWPLKGTPLYMDPIIKRLLDKNNQMSDEKKESWNLKEELDIFKADTFSLGLILYEAATGKDINKMNTYKSLSKDTYTNIHQLNLPIQLKQLILNMIEFEQSNRMNILQLNAYLKQFIQFMKTSEQIKCVQQTEENIRFQEIVKLDHIHQDWFEVDLFDGVFNQSIFRLQAQYEETFFIGSQKLDFYDKDNQRNEKVKKIEKDQLLGIKPNYQQSLIQDKQIEMLNKIKKHQLILIKPNYLQSIFQEKISSDECIVLFNNKKAIIKLKMIQTMQSPQYKENQILEMYDQKYYRWEFGLVSNVIKERKKYELQISKRNQKLLKYVVQVPFNSLKLRVSCCIENLINVDEPISYQYQKVRKHELKLLTYDHEIINWNSLFEVDLDWKDRNLTKEDVLQITQEFKRNHFSKGNLNIRISENQNKFDYDHLFSGNVFRVCYFQGFDIQIGKSYLDIFKSEPIQLFWLAPSEITFSQLIRLFKVLKTKKLKRFNLQIEKITCKNGQITQENEPTSKQLTELNSQFSSFIMNKEHIYEFFLKIMFGKYANFTLMQPFGKIQNFINNQQDTLERFTLKIIVGEHKHYKVERFGQKIFKDINYIDDKWKYDCGLYNGCSFLEMRNWQRRKSHSIN